MIDSEPAKVILAWPDKRVSAQRKGQKGGGERERSLGSLVSNRVSPTKSHSLTGGSMPSKHIYCGSIVTQGSFARAGSSVSRLSMNSVTSSEVQWLFCLHSQVRISRGDDRDRKGWNMVSRFQKQLCR